MSILIRLHSAQLPISRYSRAVGGHAPSVPRRSRSVFEGSFSRARGSSSAFCRVSRRPAALLSAQRRPAQRQSCRAGTEKGNRVRKAETDEKPWGHGEVQDCGQRGESVRRHTEEGVLSHRQGMRQEARGWRWHSPGCSTCLPRTGM